MEGLSQGGCGKVFFCVCVNLSALFVVAGWIMGSQAEMGFSAHFSSYGQLPIADVQCRPVTMVGGHVSGWVSG